MMERKRQVNVPLPEEIFNRLERFCTEKSKQGQLLSKAKVARDGLISKLYRLMLSERITGLVNLDGLYQVLDSLAGERSPLKYKTFYGGASLELIFPVSISLLKGEGERPSFIFSLGSDLVLAHQLAYQKVLEREGSKDPISCCVKVIDAQGEEIFSSKELKVDATEGSAEEIGAATRSIPFPEDRFAEHEDQQLRWRLIVKFKRLQPLGDREIVREVSLEREARFRVLSEEGLKALKLREKYFEALNLMMEGLYEDAERVCMEAARMDKSRELADLIRAEIYRRRALGLIGAPGEKELDDPIDKFSDIYNHLLDEISRKEQ